MKIGKWGDSLAVRLPAELVETMGLKEGDVIELVIEPPISLSEMAVRKSPSPADVQREFQRFRGRLSADFTFSRDEANGAG
ncbi:AbrB/MazE/SpoVT family DNA-binding domain-containing protein [Bordetella ansorpii]|uniref:AbrB/MazE/SpoVT family DNA-binding domain-containing protein n=1 Tax=Bordetella ansorpii TaxID=288768 RepID=UPI00082E7A37|nr:AbrB/MazE/SpoVT family DNA-binding domain-containing protein [Bordetella ansorpii]